MGYLILISYLALSAALGAGYAWLIDQSTWAHVISMPFRLTAVGFCLLCAWIIAGRNAHKRLYFHAAYLWAVMDLVLTYLGKGLAELGALDLGWRIYSNRGYGIVLGLMILALAVVVELYLDNRRADPT